MGHQLEWTNTVYVFFLAFAYTANGLELDFYVLRNFVYEIQPRQGLNLNRWNLNATQFAELETNNPPAFGKAVV